MPAPAPSTCLRCPRLLCRPCHRCPRFRPCRRFLPCRPRLRFPPCPRPRRFRPRRPFLRRPRCRTRPRYRVVLPRRPRRAAAVRPVAVAPRVVVVDLRVAARALQAPVARQAARALRVAARAALARRSAALDPPGPGRPRHAAIATSTVFGAAYEASADAWDRCRPRRASCSASGPASTGLPCPVLTRPRSWASRGAARRVSRAEGFERCTSPAVVGPPTGAAPFLRGS